MTAFPTEDFFVTRGQRGFNLVGAYVAKAETHAELPVLEMHAWSLDLSRPDPRATPCLTGRRDRFTRAPVLIEVRYRRVDPSARGYVKERWRRKRADVPC